MTKESQETIRRLEVLARAYDRSAKVDHSLSSIEREAMRKARSIRAAIKQIEMMEGEL